MIHSIQNFCNAIKNNCNDCFVKSNSPQDTCSNGSCAKRVKTALVIFWDFDGTMLLLPRWTGCSLCLIIAATTILFFIFAFNSVDNREVINDAQQDSSSSSSASTSTLNKKPKIWVSMSLCFGETTTKHGKQNYPYADVTLLSILIWNYFYPPESGKSGLAVLLGR